MAADVPFPEPTALIKARGEIAVWTCGEGAPVVLVHGFPDHPIGLLTTAAELSRHGLRCICPALPGYLPSSTVSDGDYGIQAVGDDLLAVMDALELERVALVGHDWGAEIGYPLVARAPERFSCLVALAVPHPAGYAVRRTLFAEIRTAWYAMFLAYAPGAADVAAQPSWLTALVQSWSPGFHWEQWPAVCDAIAKPDVMEAVCAYYLANLSTSLPAPLVRTPTTIIHGAQDGCIHPIAYEKLEGWFENGLSRHLLPDAGHWPHLERPAETISLVVDALRSVGWC
jgi:pimeloyl-ACP methyl ester carboxylesterase